jgi:hypothetical protein
MVWPPSPRAPPARPRASPPSPFQPLANACAAPGCWMNRARPPSAPSSAPCADPSLLSQSAGRSAREWPLKGALLRTRKAGRTPRQKPTRPRIACARRRESPDTMLVLLRSPDIMLILLRCRGAPLHLVSTPALLPIPFSLAPLLVSPSRCCPCPLFPLQSLRRVRLQRLYPLDRGDPNPDERGPFGASWAELKHGARTAWLGIPEGGQRPLDVSGLHI